MIEEPTNSGSTETPAEAAKTGVDVIASYLKTLPQSPGVYRMLDASGDVIYVGKARSLKARVSNYIRLGGHTNRIARMILATASMEFVASTTRIRSGKVVAISSYPRSTRSKKARSASSMRSRNGSLKATAARCSPR